MSKYSDIIERLEKADGPSRERFMREVFPEPMSGCWIWMGRTYFDTKYGRAKPYFMFGGKQLLAHRASKAMFHGAYNPKAYICHHCDTPQCVNPDHLYVGDHASNMADMKRRKRYFAAIDPERVRQLGRLNGAKNNWCRGARNPKAKLTKRQVDTIRRSKQGPTALGREYGVDRTTIQRIRRGALWT